MVGKMTGDRNRLLMELLRPLVGEWGRAEVSRCLARFEDSGPLRANLEFSRGSQAGRTKSNSPPGARQRRSHEYVARIVERMNLPESRRHILRDLAFRFEERTFLPTIGDIRNFLEMHDAGPANFHTRSASFPKIVAVLLAIPDQHLQKILVDNAHSGPSRLGPLSDAIRAIGAAIDSGEKPPDPADQIADPKGTRHE